MSKAVYSPRARVVPFPADPAPSPAEPKAPAPERSSVEFSAEHKSEELRAAPVTLDSCLSERHLPEGSGNPRFEGHSGFGTLPLAPHLRGDASVQLKSEANRRYRHDVQRRT